MARILWPVDDLTPAERAQRRIAGAASASKRHDAARDARIHEMRRKGLSLAAIGQKLGISRERVRQILEREPAA